MIAVSVLVSLPTFRSLWALWLDTRMTTYTHGTLIAAICVWLLWRERETLAGTLPKPTWQALPALLIVSFLWVVSVRANVLTVHAALWPLLTVAAVWAAAGRCVALAIAFPLGYLWFAVPIWDHMNGLLQDMTILAVSMLTRLTGVPARIIDDMVLIPQGQFRIAAGCSGLHFFMVGLAIAALAGQVYRDTLRTRLMLLALVAFIAVVSNWLRVYLIILAGYLTDMQHYLVQVDHYKFGWLVFAVFMIGFFVVLRRLPRHDAPRPGPEAAKIVPVPHRTGLVSTLAVLAFLPLLTFVGWSLATGGAHEAPLEAPLVDGFSGPLSPGPAWVPVYRGAQLEARAAYVSGSGRVLEYYENRYYRQAQGEELVGYRNELFPGKRFSVQGQRTVTVQVGDFRAPALEIRLKDKSGTEWIALRHYEISGRKVASDRLAQLLGGLMSIWKPASAGVRVVAAPCDRGCDTTRDELNLLLAQLARISP